MKALLLSLCVVALCAVGLAPTASAASAYHCHGNHCWKITKTTSKFYVGYSDGLYNDTAGKAPLSCETDSQVSKKYTFSASVSGDANFIFGSISASVKGGLEKSASSGMKVKVGPVSVPAWTSERCQRGILDYTFTIKYCVGSSHAMSCANHNVSAPQGPSWRLTRTKISH
jgi:hypothetical protein